jgi:lysophospholipase L1-like esterase
MTTIRWSGAVLLLLLSVKVQALPIKIACIGDSITAGANLGNPSLEAYPGRLQRLLGTNDYTVRNFGVSGRTLLRQGDYPYWKEPYFKASHDWLPDIVIIQLGTNDGKPYNWRYGTNFVSDYEDMIASYATLTNTHRIILCSPCPVYGNGAYDINPGTVATNIAPAVRDIATRVKLELVDLQTRLAGHPEWFPDNVHPNSKGDTVMAALILSTVQPAPMPQPDPELEWTHPQGSRIALSWPIGRRSLVPMFTSALRASNTVWSVAEPIIYLDGDVVRQTNSTAGATSRIYRLWQP